MVVWGLDFQIPIPSEGGTEEGSGADPQREGSGEEPKGEGSATEGAAFPSSDEKWR